ncbi:anthrone oxygenase family protein [Streptomyces tirandamycinicus]
MSTMADLLLALAVISNGLYAGFMLIFQTGVMPALARQPDDRFVPVMRQINEEVPRPVFLAVFLAVVVFPAAALAVPGEDGSGTRRWLVIAGLVSAALNHLVTIVGNIPLNNALASSETSPDSEARAAFEARWNRYHRIRTVLILAAFVLLVAAALS